MPTDINTSDFNRFIKECSEAKLSDANEYADIGDEFIKLAIECNSTQFKTESAALSTRLEQIIKEKHPQLDPTIASYYSISNMMSCLLYSQTRQNFSHGQGYGKGANINQYGDDNQSEQAVRNMTQYFSQSVKGKDNPYPRWSTHDQWRKKEKDQAILPYDVTSDHLGCDITPNTEGSIPAPLKGIRTGLMVAGEENGVVKLLLKPENWGLKKLYDSIFHYFDYFLTRFTPHTIKSLEGRQETKFTKEASVKDQVNILGGTIKDKLKSVNDKKLKSLFTKINSQLTSVGSKKGFEKPLETLEKISNDLNTWLKENSNHSNLDLVNQFVTSVNDSKAKLIAARDKKYDSKFQIGSEVRLLYSIENGKLTTQVDRSAQKTTDPSNYQKEMETIDKEIVERESSLRKRQGTYISLTSSDATKNIRLPKTLSAVRDVIKNEQLKGAGANWHEASKTVSEIVNKSQDQPILSKLSGRSKDTQTYYNDLKRRLKILHSTKPAVAATLTTADFSKLNTSEAHDLSTTDKAKSSSCTQGFKQGLQAIRAEKSASTQIADTARSWTIL